MNAPQFNSDFRNQLCSLFTPIFVAANWKKAPYQTGFLALSTLGISILAIDFVVTLIVGIGMGIQMVREEVNFFRNRKIKPETTLSNQPRIQQAAQNLARLPKTIKRSQSLPDLRDFG